MRNVNKDSTWEILSGWWMNGCWLAGIKPITAGFFYRQMGLRFEVIYFSEIIIFVTYF